MVDGADVGIIGSGLHFQKLGDIREAGSALGAIGDEDGEGAKKDGTQGI
jgi:hypothetical protein